ncbi:hypothetical protein BH09PAT2_BH09PAT2_03300 [soil metagenome]
MDTILALFAAPTSDVFIVFFFKAFAILFSFLFLLYAIVLTRQTQEMNQIFTTSKSQFLFFVSVLHIVLALILIVASFVLI